MNVSFYPPRLSDADIGRLNHIAEIVSKDDGPFSGWLATLVKAECERRSSDDLIEVWMPDIPHEEWTNAELSRALQTAWICYQSSSELHDLFGNVISTLTEVLSVRIKAD